MSAIAVIQDRCIRERNHSRSRLRCDIGLGAGVTESRRCSSAGRGGGAASTVRNHRVPPVMCVVGEQNRDHIARTEAMRRCGSDRRIIARQ